MRRSLFSERRFKTAQPYLNVKESFFRAFLPFARTCPQGLFRALRRLGFGHAVDPASAARHDLHLYGHLLARHGREAPRNRIDLQLRHLPDRRRGPVDGLREHRIALVYGVRRQETPDLKDLHLSAVFSFLYCPVGNILVRHHHGALSLLSLSCSSASR